MWLVSAVFFTFIAIFVGIFMYGILKRSAKKKEEQIKENRVMQMNKGKAFKEKTQLFRREEETLSIRIQELKDKGFDTSKIEKDLENEDFNISILEREYDNLISKQSESI